MEWRIIIVDDLKSDRTLMENWIRRFFKGRTDHSLSSVEAFPDGESLLKAFAPGTVHLAFLDICMDQINGIDLAGRLRNLDPALLIVFTTTSRDYAFDAFPIHPFDYLVKPFTGEQLQKVLLEAFRTVSPADREITIRVSRSSYQVPLRNISAVVASGHSVEVRLTDGQVLRSIQTFSEISSQLADDRRFLQCNRGILINMDHVLAPDEDVLRMKDGKVYPIRVRKRSEVLSQFSQYMISRLEGGNARD